jgi:hypothetical protein
MTYSQTLPAISKAPLQLLPSGRLPTGMGYPQPHRLG